MRFLLSLRRVRDAAGQQEDVTLADVDSAEAALGQDRETHVALPHVEQLLPLLQVEIFPLVGAPDKENLQLVVVHHLVTDGRQEELLVVTDPPPSAVVNNLPVRHLGLLLSPTQPGSARVCQGLDTAHRTGWDGPV